MADLSITTAWEDSTRLAAREFGLLYPIALLLMELPALLLMLILPWAPATDPDAVGAALMTQMLVGPFEGAGRALLFLGLSFAVFLVQTFASLALTWLALTPGGKVGDGFAAAWRRLPAMFGAIILMGIVIVLAMFPLVLLAAAAGPQSGPGRGLMVTLLTLATLVLGFVALARWVAVTPAAVSEQLGPLAIIQRSWALTKGHFWRILGALVLIGLVFSVAAFALSIVLGLVVSLLVGSPLANFTAAFVLQLLNSLFYAAYAVFMFCFVAQIYLQLTADDSDAA